MRESPDRAGRRGELDCVSAASLEQAQVVLVAPNGELAQAECAGLASQAGAAASNPAKASCSGPAPTRRAARQAASGMPWP